MLHHTLDVETDVGVVDRELSLQHLRVVAAIDVDIAETVSVVFELVDDAIGFDNGTFAFSRQCAFEGYLGSQFAEVLIVQQSLQVDALGIDVSQESALRVQGEVECHITCVGIQLSAGLYLTDTLAAGYRFGMDTAQACQHGRNLDVPSLQVATDEVYRLA